MSTLSEYLIPFIKVEGKCICMKSSDIDTELENAKNAINILGCKIESKDKFNLPNSDLGRSVIILKKVKSTPSKFPRKAGNTSKRAYLRNKKKTVNEKKK